MLRPASSKLTGEKFDQAAAYILERHPDWSRYSVLYAIECLPKAHAYTFASQAERDRHAVDISFAIRRWVAYIDDPASKPLQQCAGWRETK